MKVIKVLNFGTDSEGDTFSFESFKDMESVPLLINHQPSRLIGLTNIVITPFGIYAAVDEKTCEGKYPSIGFKIIKKQNGITYGKIFSIGLCDNPNIDPTINKI